MGADAGISPVARLANNTVVPYGLGQDVQKVLGHPAVSHGGAVHGFQSFLLDFPERDIAIAVVTNAFPAPAGGNPQLLAMTVANAALGSL